MSLDFAVARATAPQDRFWSRLTTNPHKWALYRDEPGFKVAHALLLAEAGPEVIDSLHRHAILMVKPEGWIDRIFPQVERFLAANGFQIVGSFRSRLTPVMTREIWRYQWNIAAIERIELSELLLSLGPAYGFLLEDLRPADEVPAAVRLARLKGPALTDRQRPGQLRYEVRAPCRIVSYVHIPDEPADIIRDLSVLLDRPAMVRLLTGPRAPLTVDPDLLEDLATIDLGLPATAPIGAPGDSLWRRARLAKDSFAACRDGVTYRIPASLWRDLLDLCADVSALPTPGRKRVEPLADIAS